VPDSSIGALKTVNPQVPGSSPGRGANFFITCQVEHACICIALGPPTPVLIRSVASDAKLQAERERVPTNEQASISAFAARLKEEFNTMGQLVKVVKIKVD
jgi:hypothetical protein